MNKTDIKNNYWKTLKNTHRHYSAWPGGWEIHVRIEEGPIYHAHYRNGNHNKPWNPKTGYMIDKAGNEIIRKTVRYDIPRECPRASRANFRIKLDRDKRIAQASTDYESYKALRARIDEEDWEFIEKNDLTGTNFRNWAHNTRTADEVYRLHRYN